MTMVLLIQQSDASTPDLGAQRCQGILCLDTNEMTQHHLEGAVNLIKGTVAHSDGTPPMETAP